MLSFSDFYRESKQLLEMSQEIDNIPKENKEEAKVFFESIFDINHLKHLEGDIYLLTKGLKPSDFVVYVVKDNKPIGASFFTQTGVFVNNKEEYAYIAKYTYCWGNYKGFMFNVYSTFSKYKKHYIMSDQKQTEFSKIVWKRWYNKKENILEIFAYDYEEKRIMNENEFKDIENTWCKSERCRRYRIVVMF